MEQYDIRESLNFNTTPLNCLIGSENVKSIAQSIDFKALLLHCNYFIEVDFGVSNIT